MSIRAVAWVLDHSPAAGTDLLVLIALADYANETGLCWPSMRRLAHRARISERTARRAIRSLEGIGQVVTEVGGTARQGSSRYRLTFADPLPIDVPPVILSGGQDDRPPDTALSAPPGHSLVRRTTNEPTTPPAPPPSGGATATPCKAHKRARRSCPDCQAGPPPPLPPWCGRCDGPEPARRFVDDGAGGVKPCPECHPGATSRRSA